MSANHKSEKSEKPTHKTSKKDNKLQVVIIVVILALVGLLVVMQSNKDSDKKDGGSSSNTSNPTGKAKLFLKPTSQSVTAGSSVTFEVWVDTGNEPVNAVQANLTYPTDKFEFNSVDGKGSAFEIQAQSTGGDGKINIARGHIGNVKGVSLVAKVTLTAKSDKGDAKVEFAEGSAVVRSTDHLDILKDKAGSTFEVSRVSGRLS